MLAETSRYFPTKRDYIGCYVVLPEMNAKRLQASIIVFQSASLRLESVSHIEFRILT